jgi:hypothetical protein
MFWIGTSAQRSGLGGSLARSANLSQQTHGVTHATLPDVVRHREAPRKHFKRLKLSDRRGTVAMIGKFKSVEEHAYADAPDTQHHGSEAQRKLKIVGDYSVYSELVVREVVPCIGMG